MLKLYLATCSSPENDNAVTLEEVAAPEIKPFVPVYRTVYSSSVTVKKFT
jgi:hypothetical protein